MSDRLVLGLCVGGVVIIAGSCLLRTLPRYTSPSALKPVSAVQTFSAVQQGEQARVIFGIRNVGAAPVTVTSIIPECGCTVPSRDLIGRSLAAGETVECEVVIRTDELVGHIEKKIVVKTHNEAAPPLTLFVVGYVAPVASITPSVLYFTMGLPQEFVEKSVVVQIPANAPPTDVAISDVPDWILADFAYSEGIWDEQDGIYSRPVIVRPKLSLETGIHDGYVTIRHGERNLSLRVVAVVSAKRD